ncbi:MAG: PH domain-containing protein [Phycisphaeraceae bacterium]|nr:MAG: PH domain-containing protein [Phycisphaeraceae bacterium]
MRAHTEKAAEWVYRGLWSILASWFKVPEQPPELPAAGGSPVRTFHPSRRFLSYLKFYFWFALVAIDLGLAVLWLLVFLSSHLAGLLLAPIFLVVMVVPDIFAYVAIHLRYDTTWYVMSDHTLRCRRGVWLICEHTITFENVQDIHVRRGPVQQYFGISHIVVETAGSSEGTHDNAFTIGNKAIMEGIDNPDEIRSLILERVRRSKAAGLGDERTERPEPTRWRPAEITLLREIRDDLRGCLPT